MSGGKKAHKHAEVKAVVAQAVMAVWNFRSLQPSLFAIDRSLTVKLLQLVQLVAEFLCTIIKITNRN